MESIHVLIADDHSLYRAGIRKMLSVAQDIEIVGEATNGDEAVAQALALQPDVILMDLKMPGINGIEATRRRDRRRDAGGCTGVSAQGCGSGRCNSGC